MNHPLNHQPSTLANWDSAFYANLWNCASKRASIAAQDDNVRDSRSSREYETGSAMFDMSQRRKKPAFSPDCGENIIPSERYDSLLIDRSKHIASAINCEPSAMPDYLSQLICDDEKGWQDKVAEWLSINDDCNTAYFHYHAIIGNDDDLSGEIELTWFTDGKGDKFWRTCWVIIDSQIYDLTDSSIADCDILKTTIGWYVCDLDGEPLPDECRTDRLSSGYARNPTYQLEKMLLGDSKPIYHWGFGCYVGRLECWPHPVKLFPEPPYYS